VQNAEGVNKAVGKAKHFAAMGPYNILPPEHFRNIKLDTTNTIINGTASTTNTAKLTFRFYQREAMLVQVPVRSCVCVCHKSVFYRNG